MQKEIKLNLGCGKNYKDGYINVDKYGEPDLQVDLEVFPWPWEDSCVTEIILKHVLEHLGQETETYLNIIKEIYRICKNQAMIHITVPHPRHDDFINDPTHVRVITPESIGLFSKINNQKWIDSGAANSPLGLYLGVDMEITHLEITPDPVWVQLLKDKKITEQELSAASKKYNNVIKEYRITAKVKKHQAVEQTFVEPT